MLTIINLVLIAYYLIHSINSNVFFRTYYKIPRYGTLILYLLLSAILMFEIRNLEYYKDGDNLNVIINSILGFILLIYIYSNFTSPKMKNNERFNPPENRYMNKEKRLNLKIKLFLLFVAYYALMYYLYDYINVINIGVLSFIMLILIYLDWTYSNCKYDLPISWNI